ncbi:hypothetical protein [Flavobacterium sp. I-STPA6A]|mgnify:FL=1|jgi:hypothetical protein|uniref:hypothetical protein n=1 Tax=Flavobacterium sp. I-STPA6A TaxID=2590450 RepID=UPI00131BA2D4|nr:hypothetical protein [Flavobacterium sp. I-STPA6A]
MKTNSTIKLTQTETSKTVEFSIPNEEAENVTAGLLKTNHLRGLYSDYCILNQEFLKYVVSSHLTAVQMKMIFLLMSEMDKENKVLLNNDLLIKRLKTTKMSVIESVKKLVFLKIIVRQKLDVSKYEYQINYDILNPQMAFKDKSTKENITKHKALMSQETPYIKQYNTGGDIDLVNIQTGEVFETVKQFIKKPTKNKFTNDELPSSPFDEI